jgi:hypothetical protein
MAGASSIPVGETVPRLKTAGKRRNYQGDISIVAGYSPARTLFSL